jgi:hypothetical protein
MEIADIVGVAPHTSAGASVLIALLSLWNAETRYLNHSGVKNEIANYSKSCRKKKKNEKRVYIKRAYLNSTPAPIYPPPLSRQLYNSEPPSLFLCLLITPPPTPL